MARFAVSQEHRCASPVSAGIRNRTVLVIRDKTAEAGLFPVMRIETMGLFTKDIKTMDDLFVH